MSKSQARILEEGHVPHSGILLSIKADRLVINESGMTLILDTHHSLIS